MDANKYRGPLEEELKLLEEELQTVGRRNPNNPDDWEALPDKGEVEKADRNESADAIESYEANTAILKRLETRYNNVKNALKRIDDGSFGKCEVSGEPIETDRLDANPAATTCKAHMND